MADDAAISQLTPATLPLALGNLVSLDQGSGQRKATLTDVKAAVLLGGGAGMTDEQVQDLIGGAVGAPSTQTFITVTYNDTDGVLNFVVPALNDGTFAGNSALHFPTQQSVKTYVDTGLALKAPLASPTLTGTPAAPTAAPGTNTTQLATTAFAFAGLALKANAASPAFTGTVTFPTGLTGVLRADAGVASVDALALRSVIAGVTGADQVTNIMSLTTAEYNAIGAKNASTLYVITDAT